MKLSVLCWLKTHNIYQSTLTSFLSPHMACLYRTKNTPSSATLIPCYLPVSPTYLRGCKIETPLLYPQHHGGETATMTAKKPTPFAEPKCLAIRIEEHWRIQRPIRNSGYTPQCSPVQPTLGLVPSSCRGASDWGDPRADTSVSAHPLVLHRPQLS